MAKKKFTLSGINLILKSLKTRLENLKIENYVLKGEIRSLKMRLKKVEKKTRRLPK